MSARGARVVGAGLIGTSIALRLKEIGWRVDLSDSNPTAQRLAQDLVGENQNSSAIEFVIVATPPEQVISTILTENKAYSQAIFIDVSSTKTNTQHEIDSFPELKVKFVGTHPIAGREQSGAGAARSDLFIGRAWILTPSPAVSESDVKSVESLITALGSTPYRMDAKEHDRLFARISHLPQILSTALAGSVAKLGNQVDLSGQGLRDMLRLAGSNGELWSEILISNRDEVLKALDEMKALLDNFSKVLEENDERAILEFFRTGNLVQSSLSGKHGGQPRDYAHLSVVIEDKPGQLGALFKECAEVDANVEDLSLEHSPNQETGLIRLALSKDDASKLENHLLKSGWKVHRQ